MIGMWAFACAVAADRGVATPGFWDVWGDGQAEVSGYQLTTPRYGAPRTGYAVLIFVTETFTAATAVKSDGGHSDEYPVLKLNDVRHFQTGIYDYDLMTSTFVPLDGRAPIGVPAKVSFGSQEWCGNLFDQLTVRGRAVRRFRHSYFDGEADVDDAWRAPRGVIFADTLPIVVRGLTGEPLPDGQPRPLQAYPTLADLRANHGALAVAGGVLSRDAAPHEVDAPAGHFAVWSVTWAPATGPSTTWDVEIAPPHRLIGWRRSDGESAVLTGSTRRQYWKENVPGGEAALRELGLEPR
jgi:hypothetical protein